MMVIGPAGVLVGQVESGWTSMVLLVVMRLVRLAVILMR
jgi:hypothetical protein